MRNLGFVAPREPVAIPSRGDGGSLCLQFLEVRAGVFVAEIFQQAASVEIGHAAVAGSEFISNHPLELHQIIAGAIDGDQPGLGHGGEQLRRAFLAVLVAVKDVGGFLWCHSSSPSLETASIPSGIAWVAVRRVASAWYGYVRCAPWRPACAWRCRGRRPRQSASDAG